jgi:hypothetical protein
VLRVVSRVPFGPSGSEAAPVSDASEPPPQP